jgi:hypothetical protein
MNAVNRTLAGLSLKTRAMFLLVFALNGVTAVLSLAPESRVLAVEWVLLHRLLLAVLCGAILFNQGWSRLSQPTPHQLRVHALLATGILAPCALAAAPERVQSASGILAVLVISALLGVCAAILYSLVLAFWRRRIWLQRYTPFAWAALAAAYLVCWLGRDWFVARAIEGPAVALRPVAQSLASGHSPVWPILGLALIAVALRALRTST